MSPQACKHVHAFHTGSERVHACAQRTHARAMSMHDAPAQAYAPGTCRDMRCYFQRATFNELLIQRATFFWHLFGGRRRRTLRARSARRAASEKVSVRRVFKPPPRVRAQGVGCSPSAYAEMLLKIYDTRRVQHPTSCSGNDAGGEAFARPTPEWINERCQHAVRYFFFRLRVARPAPHRCPGLFFSRAGKVRAAAGGGGERLGRLRCRRPAGRSQLLSWHRRRHVHCAGMGARGLKTTTSPRRSFRVPARAYPRNWTCRRRCRERADIEPAAPISSAGSDAIVLQVTAMR